MGYLNPQTEMEKSVDQKEEWMNIGAECIYRHKGPFMLPAEDFKAEILGFTATGRVRIRAFDRPNNEWYKTTVGRRSLRPLE